MPDGTSPCEVGDETLDLKSMRGMSLGAVNPLKVTSMVGPLHDEAGEFAVTRIGRDDGRTSIDRGLEDHRRNKMERTQPNHGLDCNRGDNRKGDRRGQDDTLHDQWNRN